MEIIEKENYHDKIKDLHIRMYDNEYVRKYELVYVFLSIIII